MRWLAVSAGPALEAMGTRSASPASARSVSVGPGIAVRYLLGQLISACLFPLCHSLSFPPSCLPFSSLLGCIGIPASPGLSEHFRAIAAELARLGAAGSWQKAVFRHLSRLQIPKHPGAQTGSDVQLVTTRGFSAKALKRPWVFQAAPKGGDLLPPDEHTDQECGHWLNLHLSQRHRVTETAPHRTK